MQTLFLFLGGVGFNEILLLIVLFIAVPLAVRSLLLWYWKVNVTIENQQKQLDLLSKILDKLSEKENGQGKG